MSDGTYAAVAYDMPVHYEQNQTWVEIDNTLVPATMTGEFTSGKVVRNSELTSGATVQSLPASLADTAYFENNQNDFVVQLPQSLTEDKPIIVNHDGHSLRFFATEVEQNTAATVSQPKSETEIAQTLNSRLATATDQAQQAKIQNDIATSVHNIRSVVSYAGVQDDIDINYYVYGQTLKEDIVLHSVPIATSFSFRFAFDGLRAALQEDNSVLFYNDADEAVFVIASPYMADFDEGYSTDIEVELTSTATGCVYKVTPDRAWLEAPERVYPVTIDPTLTEKSTQNTNYIHDNGVQQSNPTTKYYDLDRIYVGSGTSSTEGRMYFKLTQWPSATNLNAASITKAELALNYYPQSNWQTGNNITINVARVTSAWNTTTLDWNSRPSVSSTLVDYNSIGDVRGKTSGADVYDVTSWVKAHYNNASADYGICLYPSTVKTSLNRVCYISSDYYGNTALRPLITIYYNSYNLYFKQFYDGGYVSRYGSTASSDIAGYTTVVAGYFFKVFGIKVHSTVSTYTSPADSCTHRDPQTGMCTRNLGTECNYYDGTYHCTNNAAALYFNPTNATVSRNTKIIKWTGHINCEYCASGTNSEPKIGGVASDDFVLIHWGDSLNSATREEVSIGTIAHEVGHTLGCKGDASNTCSSNVCIMRSNVSDSTKVANLESFSSSAYCTICRNKILSYAADNL